MSNSLTLRDQLALRAPTEIPDWFVPVMPALPPVPEVPPVTLKLASASEASALSAIMRNSMSRFIGALTRGEFPDALDMTPGWLQFQTGMSVEQIDEIYASFYALVKPYRDACKARAAAHDQERLTQWPWAYADLILKHR